MRFNIAEVATLAALFVSNVRAWDVEAFTSDDCSGDANDIVGGIASDLGCYSLGSTTVDIYSLVLDYDDDTHHTVILYQDDNCECELSQALTCPGGQTLLVGECATIATGDPIKSFKVQYSNT